MVQETEFALINYFLAKLAKFDPDVLIGHALYNETLELLISRMQKLNVSLAGKLGRLKKPLGRLGGGILNKARALSQGRLLCDTFLSAKEVIKESDFSLSFLAGKHLNQNYKEIEQVLDCFQDAKSLESLLENGQLNGYLSMQLMFKLEILPLTK